MGDSSAEAVPPLNLTATLPRSVSVLPTITTVFTGGATVSAGGVTLRGSTESASRASAPQAFTAPTAPAMAVIAPAIVVIAFPIFDKLSHHVIARPLFASSSSLLESVAPSGYANPNVRDSH